MYKAYERYLHEFNNYTDTVIAKNLDDLKLPLTFDRLEGLKNTLYKTLELIDGRSGDASVYNEQLIEKNALELLGFFDGLKPVINYAAVFSAS
jgi:hypothetical protein